jgi:flagellar biosynthesis GTPase FlhF
MKLTLSILVGVALASVAFAEEAAVDATYFHPAASLYIHGDTASASNLVARGLSLHPDDGKLKRLKELLEKQKQQDDQNQKKEKKPTEEESQKEPEQEQNQHQEEQQPSEPESAEQMTEDEAKQLLDAMRQEEKNKRLQLHPVLGAPVKVDKDW